MCDELSRFLEYIGNKLKGTKQNSTATAILPESTLDKSTNTEIGKTDTLRSTKPDAKLGHHPRWALGDFCCSF